MFKAGFTAAQCKDAGASVPELWQAGCSVVAMRAAGFTAAQCKNAGILIDILLLAGFTEAECEAARPSRQEILSHAGFKPRNSNPDIYELSMRHVRCD